MPKQLQENIVTGCARLRLGHPPTTWFVSCRVPSKPTKRGYQDSTFSLPQDRLQPRDFPFGGTAPSLQVHIGVVRKWNPWGVMLTPD